MIRNKYGRSSKTCENGVDSPSEFSSEELSGHYSRISFDSGAPSTVEYLERFSIPEDHFPRFSLSKVNHEDVKRAVCSFTSQAKDQMKYHNHSLNQLSQSLVLT